jgi:Uma2 family endonuclease
MSTVASVLSAEQLLAIPDDGWRYELVQGELRRMSPAGRQHGRVTMNFAWRLAQFVRERSLGVVFAAETGFLLRRDPDTVRAPDVAFVRTSRISGLEPQEGFFPGPPDLAVEVVSPSDTFTEVEDKVFQWLGAGAAAVLVINPSRRNVSLYRGRDDFRLWSEGETLDLSFVVPGFSIGVGEIFE